MVAESLGELLGFVQGRQDSRVLAERHQRRAKAQSQIDGQLARVTLRRLVAQRIEGLIEMNDLFAVCRARHVLPCRLLCIRMGFVLIYTPRRVLYLTPQLF